MPLSWRSRPPYHESFPTMTNHPQCPRHITSCKTYSLYQNTVTDYNSTTAVDIDVYWACRCGQQCQVTRNRAPSDNGVTSNYACFPSSLKSWATECIGCQLSTAAQSRRWSRRRLQHNQNSLTRAVAKAPKFSHTSPILRSLHRLKINERTEYRLLSVTYEVLTTSRSTYLCPTPALYSFFNCRHSSSSICLLIS